MLAKAIIFYLERLIRLCMNVSVITVEFRIFLNDVI